MRKRDDIPGIRRYSFLNWVNRQWKRLPESFRWNLEDTFQPEDISERLLPGEEPLLEIRMAWYRDIMGSLVFQRFPWLLLVSLLAMGVLLLVTAFNWLIAMLPFVLLALTIGEAIRERVEYLQWRLLKTNARLIISIPQPDGWPLVDNIELKAAPSVVDTNWSENPVWRTFQFFTGARDVYLSLSAYKFVEGKAEVGDALVIPDVMPRDIFALKQLVFEVKKPEK
jgi:hypothetical protein